MRSGPNRVRQVWIGVKLKTVPDWTKKNNGRVGGCGLTKKNKQQTKGEDERGHDGQTARFEKWGGPVARPHSTAQPNRRAPGGLLFVLSLLSAAVPSHPSHLQAPVSSPTSTSLFCSHAVVGLPFLARLSLLSLSHFSERSSSPSSFAPPPVPSHQSSAMSSFFRRLMPAASPTALSTPSAPRLPLLSEQQLHESEFHDGLESPEAHQQNQNHNQQNSANGSKHNQITISSSSSPNNSSSSSSSSSSSRSAPHPHSTTSLSLSSRPIQVDLESVAEADGDVEIEEVDESHVGFPALFVRPANWHFVALSVLVLFFVLCSTVFKSYLADAGISTADVLIYGSIPVVSVIFTYCHIWLALWMTFYPVEFFGLCQIPGTNTGLGWQGIIPFKAEKMARMSVQLMTTQLIDVREVFSRLDPQRVAVEMKPVLHTVVRSVLESVANAHSEQVWRLLPARIKLELIRRIEEDAPLTIAGMMADIKERIDEVFDIESMVVGQLTKDKQLLNQTFIRCGYKELSFIRNSGAYLGGLFGVLQLGIWLLIYFLAPDMPKWWFLPSFGFVVGAATNWLALKMIFQPVKPRIFCGMVFQGLFLQRQTEVSAEYGRTVAVKILNARNILTALVAGVKKQPHKTTTQNNHTKQPKFITPRLSVAATPSHRFEIR